MPTAQICAEQSGRCRDWAYTKPVYRYGNQLIMLITQMSATGAH